MQADADVSASKAPVAIWKVPPTAWKIYQIVSFRLRF